MTGSGLRARAQVLAAAAECSRSVAGRSRRRELGAGRFRWSKLSAEVAEQLVSAEPEAEEKV